MNRITHTHRNGFTLVMILITMVIIAVMAAMTMTGGTALKSDESQTSAADLSRAARVVDDLKSLKIAAQMYYADNGAWPEGTGSSWKKNLEKYLDRPLDEKYGEVLVIGSANDSRQYLGFSAAALSKGIKQELADNQGNTGIFGGDSTGSIRTFTVDSAFIFTSMK